MTIDTSISIDVPVDERASNIFLALGSNLGDRETNLQLATDRIILLGLNLIQASSIYETEPVGYLDQPWFLNQVIELNAAHTLVESEIPNQVTGGNSSAPPSEASALLRALLLIETDMGRKRSIPDGPRVVDIDLLLFGELVVNDSTTEIGARGPRIVVPHPRMHLRRFVLEPLCEIAGELVHPVLKQSYRELLAGLQDSSVVRLHI